MNDEDDIYNLEYQAAECSNYLHEHGLFVESRIVDKLIYQRAELLEACKAFVAYDAGIGDDGVSMMINYNNAIELCKSAVANSEKTI